MRKSLLLSSAAVAVALATPVLATDAKNEMSFKEIKAPVTDEEKRQVRASEVVVINGTEYPIAFNVLARSGDQIGDGVFGLLVDEKGQPVKNTDGSVHHSVDTDFSSLLPVGGKLYNVTHFESRPGAMYLTELAQDPETGKLTPVKTQPIDFSEFGGLWVPCAGSVTPWNTHLGSEEYPPNARNVEDAKSLDDIDDYFKPMVRYYGIDPNNTDLEAFRAKFNPYFFGYPTEIVVSEDGSAKADKHFAMGRVALELAYVMPDQKTVYISDDGTNVGLFMFVADEAGKLDAGKLYAAQWNQTGSDNGGSADLKWIDLGHATSADVKALIEKGTKFHDIFDVADMGEDGTCPEGFTAVNTTDGAECLKIKDGMELAASRLETRRYAAMKGGTTEFRKEEGITFNPATNTLYVAMSEVARGMEDNAKNGKPSDKYDRGGPNHVQLPHNKCGTVYALDVAEDSAIGSDYVAQNMVGLVSGTMTEYPEGHEFAGNKCDIDGIANPDNVTYIPGTDILIIGEDTGSGHQNDAIWAYDLNDQKLTRIFTTPYGSETTSPYWYGDINGHGYLMAVVQHPYGESDEDKLSDPADARAYNGYIGPFPVMK